MNMKKTMDEMTNKELFAEVFGVKSEGIQFDDIRDLMVSPMAIHGVGEAKAAKVYAVREIARRLMQETENKREIIHGPEDAAQIFLRRLRYEMREHFLAMALNTKNEMLAVIPISVGSLSASVVHPREVFRELLKYPLASFIVCHNHPSGNPMASREDIAVTHRLEKAGKILDIPMLDHIIVGSDGGTRWQSLKERGMMVKP